MPQSVWAVVIKYHTLINSRSLFLTVLEAESTRSRCQPIWYLVRPTSRIQMLTVKLCPHIAESEEGAMQLLFYKVTNAIHVGSLLMTCHLPKAPLLMRSHWG